jgi:plasmid replication initiation protein
MHRFSWINEWTQRADAHGNADGIDLIVPDWFYRAVLDDALVLTIDRAYFGLTGGLERWLYRLVRKHGGQQRAGWKFDFHHLYAKSASLSPFRRFAFELRELAKCQPLPGYRVSVQREAGGRETLVCARVKLSTGACGQTVDEHVPSGMDNDVPSGTRAACYPEQKVPFSGSVSIASGVPNLESNLRESNPSVVGHPADRWIIAKRAR